MTDFRALCAELADAYLRTLEHINNSTWLGYEPSDDPLLQRARAALADEPAVPQPQPPADGEVAELMEGLRLISDGMSAIGHDSDSWFVARAAELLQRQVPVPVSVSERLPGPKDCDAEGRCWWFCFECPGEHSYWILAKEVYCNPTYWLPAHALPLPEVGEWPSTSSPSSPSPTA